MRPLLLSAVLCVAGFACTPNVISSGDPDSGQMDPDAGNNPSDAGTDPNPYPGGPYGISVNRIIQNFTLPGYLATGAGVKANTLPLLNDLDLQKIRKATDSAGHPLRYLLLDISAGWCPPCNQEAQDLGLNGTKSTQIAAWAAKGGVFMTALVEGYDESTGAAPVEGDVETWINQHNVQSSVVYDPTQKLIAQGISPSAFPTNLVIDLQTMKIVSAWYGLDTTYQKWEAALGP